jgi:hypothetical protein
MLVRGPSVEWGIGRTISPTIPAGCFLSDVVDDG